MMVFSGLLLVFSAASLFYTNYQVLQLNRLEGIADNVERTAGELSYLSNDYLLHRDINEYERWQIKFNDLSNDLQTLYASDMQDRVLINQISEDKTHLQAVYNDITSKLQSSAPLPGGNELDYIRVSWSRIEVQNQGLIFDASQLAHQFRDRIDDRRQAHILLIIALLAIFVVYFFVNYIMVYRGMLQSVAELQHGAMIVGAGDLAHSFNDNRTDEIGELSRALNWMTTHLREVTASKGDLEREIAERQRAEQQVLRQNAILSGINRIFQETLICETEEEVGQVCLAVAEEITGSTIGFIGEIDAQTGRLDDIAISNPGWDACRILDRVGHGKREPVGFVIHGLYGRVLQTGEGFFTNDPAAEPDSIGTPSGHPVLAAFLGVPLFHSEKIFGMISLGNAPQGYDPEQYAAVEALAPAIVQAFISKRLEIARHEYARKLELSNRELQEFAFVASHDLQEPMRKIRAFSESLQKRLDEKSSAEERDQFQRIINAAVRMQKMIEDLLELSRVRMMGRPFQPVDLSEVAKEVISDLEMQIFRTGGKVELSPLPIVNADAMQMRQLLQNLLSNALKYHRPNLPPLIKVYSKSVSPAEVQILVEDNGIGFEQEHAQRIFQPFQRLVGRSEYEGIGMGMAISRRIIDRHGGSICAAGKPGEGSVFTITLPAVPADSINDREKNK